MLVATLASAILVTAPALGLHKAVIRFFEGEKAPPRIERDFASLDVGAPTGMAPGVISTETRRVAAVELSDGIHVLWVAPTKAGGFCAAWSEAVGGCQAGAVAPLGVSHGTLRPGLSFVSGEVDAEYVHRVEVILDDGSKVEPRIFWVSEPIGAGFFLYEAPEGREVVRVLARSEEGEVIADEHLIGTEPTNEPPIEAMANNRREVVRVATADGPAAIVESPSKTEGRCRWLEFQGRFLQPACSPKGFELQGVSLGFRAARQSVLIVGTAAARVAAVELRFEDGASVRLEPVDGFVLYAIPPEHFAPGHTASAIVTRDEAGAVVGRWKIKPVADPCYSPAPLPLGTSCP